MEGHILIIDDEASLRQTMARILQRAGYEVTTAADGRDGLALISEHAFDLVYSDIRMPDMSGLELLKVIHAKFPEL
ncbi:MAG TPA: response regulator, partial [Anaerolineales bacterium]|nr:response regulator [Anaerolineales bacterium]